MKQLRDRIRNSGLKQKFIAEKIGIGQTHLAMMLNDKATMPEMVRNSINDLLDKVLV